MPQSGSRLLLLLLAMALALLGLRLFRRGTAVEATPPAAAPDAAPLAAAAPPPDPAPRPGAPAPSDGGLPHPGGGAAGGPLARGTVVVHGAWGSGPGQFGRRRESESNPEAPMALVAGPRGELAVVDQVNRRVERFAGGKLVGTLSVGGDTIQDIALGDGGRTVLLDRLADKNVQVYDRDGRLLNEAALLGEGIPEGGGVTGVFTDDKGIYVEREHGSLWRIADAAGNTVPREQLPGRPTRDGRWFVTAAIADRGQGTVRLRAFDRATRQPAWESTVSVEAPLLAVLMLDSDRQGMIYLGATTGHESPQPPFAIVDEAIVVVRVGMGGQARGAIRLPVPPGPDETFRSLSVDDDGDILALQPGPAGLDVVRYSF